MKGLFDLKDTHVEVGGVLRCCLESVATEYEDKAVHLGDKSKCKHCGEQFTLVLLRPGMQSYFKNRSVPVWKPDWQLK